MLKLVIKALVLLIAFSLSSAAGAVGMGGISVATALGEPLKAEIELVSVGKADKDKMSARLAAPDVFKGAGLDYPANLPPMKFQLETRANGQTYLKVTTSQPVNDPFVSLLVELTWSSGQLLREYTFLLDPPEFKPEQPKAAEVQPLEPKVTRAQEAKVIAKKEDAIPARAPAPVEVKPIAAIDVAAVNKENKEVKSSKLAESIKPVESVKPVEIKKPFENIKPASNRNVASGSIKVKPGDSLIKLARETKAPDVSLERMLAAMYLLNKDEFDGNMNRLKTGKILHIPDSNELKNLGEDEAASEIHAQAADWNSYRQKLASATRTPSVHARKQIVSGKIRTSIADKTPAAKESAKEVVRLSKGEAPGDKAAMGGNVKALEDKLHALEEESTAKSKTIQENNERIALLEKNIKEMQHLIELKDQLAQSAKSAPVKTEEALAKKPEMPENKAEVASQVVSEVKPEAPSAIVNTVSPASETPPVSAVTPVPVNVESTSHESLYIGGGAAGVLGLGGLVYMLMRRRKKEADSQEDAASSETHEIEHVVGLEELTPDSTEAATEHKVDDPIGEAELLLNFGRDEQAEEILKAALKINPDDQKIRLKLLSIYASRKDTKTFAERASEVHASGDAAAWAEAAEMGRQLDPSNPLYGGEVTDEPNATDFDLPEVDFESDAVILDDVTTPASFAELDRELGLGEPEETHVEEAHENFDAQNAPQEESADNSSDLDFDIGLETPVEFTAAEHNQPEAEVVSSEDLEDSFDFGSTGEQLSAAESQQEENSAQSFDELAEDEETPAQAEDEAAFALDFPAEAFPVEETPEPEAQESVALKDAVALDLSEINLNLDPQAPASAPVEEVKDTHWHDVATKLDLAKAYHEMGDASGAREILDEVLTEGDAQQRAAAEAMLQQLPA